MTGELSEDGKWQWNGSNWIPAPAISNPNVNQDHVASIQQTSIQLNDSVIAGDVTIHQADAHEIAKAVHQSGRCPTCGTPNVALISCESVNCQSVFCFQCMQKYVHGRIILENKFGNMPMPLDVVVTMEDGSVKRYNIPLQIMRGEKKSDIYGSDFTVLPDWP